MPSLSVRDTRGSGLGQRESHISPLNGSGLTEAVLILPSFVSQKTNQTTMEDIRTVSTLALKIYQPGSIDVQEKTGMISPVPIIYLLFARYQHEKNNNIKMKISLKFKHFFDLSPSSFKINFGEYWKKVLSKESCIFCILPEMPLYPQKQILDHQNIYKYLL